MTPATTRPSGDVAELQHLEAQFADASKQSLADQPIDEMLAAYQKLGTDPGTPEVTRKMAEVRAATLKIRAEAREQYVAFQKQQEDAKQRTKASLAEGDEIREHLAKIEIKVYTAVGTLRASSVQIYSSKPGETRATLYRLTDPGSGRTLVYVRSTDPKFAELLGQFVGVKGPVATENQSQLNLKVIAPTAVDIVDPAKVNNSVAARMVPPSLQPKAVAGGAQ